MAMSFDKEEVKAILWWVKWIIFWASVCVIKKNRFLRRVDMKKVTLLLPDKIIRVLGTSRISQTSEVDLTPENMINVLVVDEYHDSFKFKREQVKVLSIESVDDED